MGGASDADDVVVITVAQRNESCGIVMSAHSSIQEHHDPGVRGSEIGVDVARVSGWKRTSLGGKRGVLRAWRRRGSPPTRREADRRNPVVPRAGSWSELRPSSIRHRGRDGEAGAYEMNPITSGASVSPSAGSDSEGLAEDSLDPCRRAQQGDTRTPSSACLRRRGCTPEAARSSSRRAGMIDCDIGVSRRMEFATDSRARATLREDEGVVALADGE